MAIETAIVLFNRDLRVRDNPALAEAARAGQTVPLFVFDERLLRSRFAAPNRVAFMLEALRDLEEALRRAGARLFVREGDPVREAVAVARECGATSRLSAYVRWGCVSPLELAPEAGERRGGGAFVRQLCWRDFHHQVSAATPSLPRRDYRPRRDRWSRSKRVLEAWRKGRTGYPLVDAAMRQLVEEGFMHNRARMTVASFLCKDLYVDWRAGARHFWGLLTDGKIADNAGNWQRVAATGNDTRPDRVLNPVRQAELFDPKGEYVRRYLPELESVEGKAIFRPWRSEGFDRLDYPERSSTTTRPQRRSEPTAAHRIGRWDGWR